MRLDTNFYSPTELTGFVRADMEQFHADENRDVFSEWFANDYVRDIEYEINQGSDFDDHVAMYRAYDAESPIGQRPGFSKIAGRIPPISEKIRLGEYDTIRAHQAGELDRFVERDATRMGRAIARRVALARVQSVLEGKVTINENGFVFEIDYDRDPTHTTTPNVMWSTPSTSDPVANLIEWQGRILDKGFRPGVIKGARQAVAAALRSTKVINAIRGSAAGVTQVSLSEFNALLMENDLPAIEVDSSTIGSVPVLGGDSIVFLPARGDTEWFGRTLWGETAEARVPEWGLDVDNDEGPGVVSGVYHDEDPVAKWTKTAAISVPLLAAPNASLAARVVA